LIINVRRHTNELKLPGGEGGFVFGFGVVSERKMPKNKKNKKNEISKPEEKA